MDIASTLHFVVTSPFDYNTKDLLNELDFVIFGLFEKITVSRNDNPELYTFG